MSYARRTVTTHNPTWQEKIPREDTRGERKFRRILESLHQTVDGFGFHSQDQGDFTCGSIVYEIDGTWKIGDQTILDKQAWKTAELWKLGYRVIRFREDEVLTYPELVAMIVQSMWTLEKELVKKK